MSSEVQLGIIKMIEDEQCIEKYEFNSDTIPEPILDFVTKRMDGKDVLPFDDIGTIEKWLRDDNCNYIGGEETVTKIKQCEKPTTTIRSGPTIIISKPDASVRKFSDFQKAQAVLKQNNNTNLLNSGDSDEIDVITLDNHSSPWNSYAMAHQENRQLLNVLTEIHPIKTATRQQQQQHQRRRTDVKRPNSIASAKRKRSKSPDENKKVPRFWCGHCDKKYQQNSSLLRHQKQIHPETVPATKSNSNNNNQKPNTEM